MVQVTIFKIMHGYKSLYVFFAQRNITRIHKIIKLILNMSSSSTSFAPYECKCRLPMMTLTSWTRDNPGRRFGVCPNRYVSRLLIFYILFDSLMFTFGYIVEKSSQEVQKMELVRSGIRD